MCINVFFILIKKRAFGLPIRTQGGRKEKTEREKIRKNWKKEIKSIFCVLITVSPHLPDLVRIRIYMIMC